MMPFCTPQGPNLYIPSWISPMLTPAICPRRLYNGRAKGRQFGTKCSSGDRIGCGIEPVSFEVQTAQIFFTKNGKRVRASGRDASVVLGSEVWWGVQSKGLPSALWLLEKACGVGWGG